MAKVRNDTLGSLSIRTMIDNPTGIGTSYVASRRTIKLALDRTFNDLYKKWHSHFSALPFLYSDGRVLYKVRVPSEDFSHNKIVYDVLIEIEPDNPQKSIKSSLREIRVLSNCPSFIFTYAYVFNSINRLVPSFKNKLPEKCLTQPPVVRNPVQTLGFEKSLYFACRYLLQSMALNPLYIKKYGRNMTGIVEQQLYNSIADPEKIIQVYRYYKSIQIKDRKKVDQRKKSDRAEYIKAYRKSTSELLKSSVAVNPDLSSKKVEKVFRKQARKLVPRAPKSSTIKKNSIRL